MYVNRETCEVLKDLGVKQDSEFKFEDGLSMFSQEEMIQKIKDDFGSSEILVRQVDSTMEQKPYTAQDMTSSIITASMNPAEAVGMLYIELALKKQLLNA